MIEAIGEALCPFASATALSAAESHELQTIIETSLEPFVSIDAAGTVLAWNAQAIETFGWTRAEALGRRVSDLIVPPELRERHCAALAAYRIGIDSAVVGERVRMPSLHRDGTPLVVELQVAATAAADGSARYHAFIRDITVIERTRADLAARERLLAESQRIAHLGSYAFDLETRNVLCSQEFFDIVGLDAARFGGTIEELVAAIYPDDRERVLETYHVALAERIPYEVEHRIVRPDGEIRYVRRCGIVSYSDAGAPIRVIVTVHDITERRLAEAAKREADERFTRSFEDSPFGLALIDARPDRFTEFVSVNDAFRKTLGFEPGELEERSYRQILDPTDVGAALAAAEGLVGDGDARDSELRFRAQDGSVVWIRQHLSLLRDEVGAPRHIFAHVENITTSRRERAAFARMHERLRRSIEDAPIGMALLEIETARSRPLRLREANAALCVLTGYDRERLDSMHLDAIVDPRDYPAFVTAFAETIACDRDRLATEARYVHADGSQRWFSLHLSLVREDDIQSRYAILQIVDSTATKRSTKRMAYMAYHDELTRALNRRGLERRLRRHLARPESAAESLTVMMLDIDYFKYVNDSFGHAMGDLVLRSFADTLERERSARDFIARLGGDEFIVVMPAIAGEAAVARAAKIREALTRDIAAQTDGRVHVTASVGIMTVGIGTTFSFDDALAAADVALATAKEDGRDRTIVAESLDESHRTLRSRMEWANRIRAALAHDGFRLHRQPIVNLATGVVDRYEFLLRMTDCDGRIVMPAEFLGEAERFGLLVDIDTWVVTEAIRLAAAEQRRGIMSAYEVNLSAASLADENIVPRVRAELERTGALPHLLVFELTETTAIRNMEKASRLIASLSALGCGFALDDFGAGFSSFYYLKRLPFDYLKIDGEFIANVVENEADRQIVQSIVALARGLKKKTIAEFVGSSAAVDLLRSYGVDFAQGYHIGKPEPVPVPGLRER